MTKHLVNIIHYQTFNLFIMKPLRKMERHSYIKIKKKELRLYHIQEVNELITLLYPMRRTINKYKRIIHNRTQFNIHQKKLLLQTAHSLTIINELYRDQDHTGQFYTTREDVFNAIFMLQNELSLPKSEYLLSPLLRWYYRMIIYHYDNNTFTAKDLAYRMGKAKSTVNAHLNELKDRELINIIEQKGHTYIYQIKEEQ